MILEKKNAQVPSGKNLILGFINRCAIHDNWNEICQHCLLLMGFIIQKRHLHLDLLGKVQGIKIFIICKQKNDFGKTWLFFSFSYALVSAGLELSSQ